MAFAQNARRAYPRLARLGNESCARLNAAIKFPRPKRVLALISATRHREPAPDLIGASVSQRARLRLGQIIHRLPHHCLFFAQLTPRP